MGREDYPVTPAIRMLHDHGIQFTPYIYRYEEHGGTHQFAAEFKVPEHDVIKTLVFETDQKKPFLVLMHGDREVSIKQLARILGVKHVTPSDSASALRSTGYQFGGTSPFGTRHQLPVYLEKTILDIPKIYINGGKRGFIIGMTPSDLQAVVHAIEVEAAILPTS